MPTVAITASASVVKSCILVGVNAELVSVRCRLVEPGRPGLPRIDVAGATAASSKETSIRILSALVAATAASSKETSIRILSAPVAAGHGNDRRASIGFERDGSSITPGSQTSAPLDLAVAVSVLVAMGVVSADVMADVLVLGELGLDGSVRRVRGTLAAAELAWREGIRYILVPESCAWEATLVDGVVVYPVADLTEAVAMLRGERPLRVERAASARPIAMKVDMSEVQGRPETALAIASAVAARRGLLLVGPPGTGKTMLARRVGTLLPAMTRAEALEVTRVCSAVGLTDHLERGPCQVRPFRAPHHTISTVALIGESAQGRRPGEVQLASCGVLYLDELNEFSSSAVDALAAALRQMVKQADGGSRPLVVASASPCPCGWLESSARVCACSAEQVERHQARTKKFADALGLSASVEVPQISLAEMRGAPAGASSADLRAHASAAMPASTIDA